MSEKIIVGKVDRGLRTDILPYAIDNDSFPTLINAYQWRGRVKRKRGTRTLARLQMVIGTTDGSGNATITIVPHPIGTSIASFVIGTDIFTDQGGSSPVTMITNSAGSGVLNRTTGVLTITGSIPATSIVYYPSLPVMGIEDFSILNNQNPGTIAFDTTYSYNVPTTSPNIPYNVSFYKNPATSSNLPAYVPKLVQTPLNWNGQNYQQFWTANYEGALWATNGITQPFNITNIGMQYMAITGVTISNAGDGTVADPAVAVLTIAASGLVIGDFLFINEVVGITGINWQTGYVTAISGSSVTVTFPIAILGGSYTSGGIAQYLTNTAIASKDCIRWYDGDPTLNSGINGWVNFAPPLIFNTDNNLSIADQNASVVWYLVGARMIVPFKDRLLFFGPVIQTSTAGSQIYLQDTVIWSQDGTPYYTCSFNGDPTFATTVFIPVLTPINQGANASAYFEDVTGFGGYLSAGVQQPITTVSINEDALIVGFYNSLQTRFLFTGDNFNPFSFFIVNSELGSSSTFSAITMDQGVISRGPRGFIMTSQTNCSRIDLDIIDQQFQIGNLNNGPERLCAQRDFINEWIYFTYTLNESTTDGNPYLFPTQTLQFNYRDNSWAIFNESYTTYGTFRRQTGETWASIGLTYPSWSDWNDAWDAGETNLLEPQVLGGNQQGYLMIRGVGTGEGNSLYISNISSSVVTSPNHSLQQGDYIMITGALGTIGSAINGQVFRVANPTNTTFTLNPTISGSYLGGGTITRFYRPKIQTKQFPTAWGLGRKTRIGPQMYLLTTTPNAQITLQIFLSQQSSNIGYNQSPILPNPASINDSLIYSTILYTCPESSNLGLTPANQNLQMVTAANQTQIWHRMNTSLIGDTVQVGFTLNDAQMSSQILSGLPIAITGASQATDCVLLSTAMYTTGQVIQINGVVGMTQLNGNNYQVISSTSSTVTIDVNTTGFSPYISGGTTQSYSPVYQTSEIELCAFVIDVSQSSMLA